jgi:hypothetical protein
MIKIKNPKKYLFKCVRPKFDGEEVRKFSSSAFSFLKKNTSKKNDGGNDGKKSRSIFYV